METTCIFGRWCPFDPITYSLSLKIITSNDTYVIGVCWKKIPLTILRDKQNFCPTTSEYSLTILPKGDAHQQTANMLKMIYQHHVYAFYINLWRFDESINGEYYLTQFST